MRKYFCIFICLLLLAGTTFSCNFAYAEDFSTSAQGAVVIERESGRVLYQKNAEMHLPMASTTKIVTALTILRNCSLCDVVTMPKEACGVEGSSVYLKPNEKLTVEELLYGLMLRSGNDCAVALALHCSGSIEKFADEMNLVAASVGCMDSHFVNPHGLHDDAHYTSAKDLATITCAALRNEDFSKIVSTQSKRIGGGGADVRVLINKNKLLKNHPCGDGVKTGYTKKAGRCFVGSATKNGIQVVVVVLNCVGMFEETEKMLDVAFEKYSRVVLVPRGKVCCASDGKGYYVCDDEFAYPLCSNDDVSKSIVCEENNLYVKLLLNGELIGKVPMRFCDG